MSEDQYLKLLWDVKQNGVKKSIFSSNGQTLPTVDKGKYTEVDKDSKHLNSVVGRILRFDLTEGKIPLYESKAVHYPSAFKEMLWFLKGNGDVAELHQSGFPGWNGWAYKKYQSTTSDDPKLTYAAFVKNYLSVPGSSYHVAVPYTDMTGWEYPDWEESFKQQKPVYKKIDQTKWLIDSVIDHPDRKSYLVTAWNPTRLYAMAKECGNESVALAACHCEHQVVIHGGKLVLRVTIRSNDLPLGNPFNVAQYGLLAHLYAKCTGFPAGELVVQITDAHVYSDQWDGIDLQLSRKVSGELPTLSIKERGQKYLTDFEYSDFTVNNYFPEHKIQMPITIVGGF